MITEDAPVVFIVDDDANVRRSIQDLCRRWRCRLRRSRRRRNFSIANAPTAPDAWFSTSDFPGMSGLDCQRSWPKPE